jgi:hypothetical protein
MSDTLSVLTASIPSVPDAPSVVQVQDSIEIRWKAPYDGGSPITNYTV